MEHLEHQLRMLRGAEPGSDAARLRDLLAAEFGCWCRGRFGVILSTGQRYTVDEIEPGLYQYRHYQP